MINMDYMGLNNRSDFYFKTHPAIFQWNILVKSIINIGKVLINKSNLFKFYLF